MGAAELDGLSSQAGDEASPAASSSFQSMLERLDLHLSKFSLLGPLCSHFEPRRLRPVVADVINLGV